MNQISVFSFIADSDTPGGEGRANCERNFHSSWRSGTAYGWLCAPRVLGSRRDPGSLSVSFIPCPCEWETELASMKWGCGEGTTERERRTRPGASLIWAGLAYSTSRSSLPPLAPPPSRIKRNPERRGYAMSADTISGEHETNRGYWTVALRWPRLYTSSWRAPTLGSL